MRRVVHPTCAEPRPAWPCIEAPLAAAPMEALLRDPLLAPFLEEDFNAEAHARSIVRRDAEAFMFSS